MGFPIEIALPDPDINAAANSMARRFIEHGQQRQLWDLLEALETHKGNIVAIHFVVTEALRNLSIVDLGEMIDQRFTLAVELRDYNSERFHHTSIKGVD